VPADAAPEPVQATTAAPEFEAWQHAMGITTAGDAPRLAERLPAAFAPALHQLGGNCPTPIAELRFP